MSEGEHEGRGRSRRKLLRAGGSVLLALGIAGCQTRQDGGTATSDQTTTTVTDDATTTASTTEESTPTQTERPPALKRNLPVTGFPKYEHTLEDQNPYALEAHHVVQALEGAGNDPHDQAEHLCENMVGHAAINRNATEQSVYELARGLAENYDEIQEQTDIDVSNFVFDVFTGYSDTRENIVIVNPVTEDGVQLPVIHNRRSYRNKDTGQTQKPGETGGNTENLNVYRDNEDGRAIFPQHPRAMEERLEGRTDNEVIRRNRGNYLSHFSDVLLGDIGEMLRPRTKEDGNQIFESRMGREDFGLFKRFHRAYMDSAHAGNEAVTDVTIEAGEFVFRSGEMAMEDPFERQN